MSAQKQILSERLERLLSSGICPADDIAKYAEDLKMLAQKTVNEQKIELKARLFKVLSDPLRLKILKLLNIREMCECEIIVAFSLTQPTASHHLEILEKEGLVASRREGKWIFFRLANKKILELIEDMFP